MPVSNKLAVPPDYISGLELEWVSTTQIRVKSGGAFVPGYQGILELTSDTLISPTLSASAWLYVYIFETPTNTGTASLEAVSTAPSTSYRGSARTKTGDTSRRYLGAIRTNASSQIYKFRAGPGSRVYVAYLENLMVAPFAVVEDGRAATPTNVSCSSVVPVGVNLAHVEFISANTTARPQIGVSDGNFTLSANTAINTSVGLLHFRNVGIHSGHTIPLDDSQQFSYDWTADPGAGLGINAYLQGYEYYR